jgi:hypothetical protein
VTSQRTSCFSSTVSASDITGRNNAPVHQRITAKWLSDSPSKLNNPKKSIAEPTINRDWIPDTDEVIKKILESKDQGRKMILEKGEERKGFPTLKSLGLFLDMSEDAIWSRFKYYNYPDSLMIKGYKVCMIR